MAELKTSMPWLPSNKQEFDVVDKCQTSNNIPWLMRATMSRLDSGIVGHLNMKRSHGLQKWLGACLNSTRLGPRRCWKPWQFKSMDKW